MVIDLANSPSFEDKAVLEFFWNSGSKLLAARYPSSEPTGRPITAISAPRSPMRNWSRPPGIPYTIIRSTRFPEFLRGIAASSPGENRSQDFARPGGGRRCWKSPLPPLQTDRTTPPIHLAGLFIERGWS